MKPIRLLLALAAALAAAGCASAPLYPARPEIVPGPPIAEPAPSKVIIHLTVTREGLQHALDAMLPPSGGGTFTLGGERAWHWSRGPIDVRFVDGKVKAKVEVRIGAELPIVGATEVPFELTIAGEPIVTSDYQARLQSNSVELKSKDMRVRTVDMLGVALQTLRDQLQVLLDNSSYDLAPYVMQAYEKIASPIDLDFGDAKGCVALKITGVEAGPNILAGGFEKDFALIVAPSVTLPCAAQPLPATPSRLANVAALPTGAFTVPVPVAARYEELAKAMTLAFTDGRLYFSKEYPNLYLTEPEVYASENQLVLKLRLKGRVGGLFGTSMDGDIYFAGHPAVADNELSVPDLEPTIDTANFLLALKAKLDGASIRDEARRALRLDLGERFGAVRAKLSSDLPLGDGMGCLRSEVSKIEVTGVHPHASYLRIHVAVAAQAGVYLPCPGAAAAPVAAPPGEVTVPAAK